jgi:uncharacterized phage protein gp47/JayE
MQDVTASDLPNADGFLRRSFLRVMAWVQAGLAHLHYGYLDWIARQATPFTATGEYLEGWAALAPTPVLREAPTYSRGTAQWSGVVGKPLPSNTICMRADGAQYSTLTAATVGGGGTVAVTVVANVAGANGNCDSGTPLTLSTVVDGINPNGTATVAVTGGSDLEQDGPMRTRMLESYAAPPHGGNLADYVTWALEVTGVTRAWTATNGAGTVSVYFMMDQAEVAFGGFPQGSNGVASNETRAAPATGDQLAIADYLYPLRPVTPIVYAVAPAPQVQNFTIASVIPFTVAQQSQVSAALTGLFLSVDSPLGTTSIEQSDCAGAIAAIGGLPSFAITSPTSWPITSAVGSLFTLGTVNFI